MALTTKQLLYINNLMYADSPTMYNENPQTSYEGRTLGEFVESISARGCASETCSAEEWARMIREIKSDPQLMNLQIKDTATRDATGEAACCLVDPSTNEAIVAFRGTGGGEWKDNFIAGTTMDNGGSDPTISTQQQKALDYMEELNLSQYDSVTVTGHSKGGNKAKTCALLNDEVDRCVSFDGQGFSDEFMEAHADDIAANQSKIENHNVDGDFVNILLNDVGNTTYYDGQRTDDNFPKNHDASSFLTDDGEMIIGKQNPEMKEMDRFLNSMLRSMSDEEKADFLDFAGEVADSALGYGHSTDRIMEVLTDPRYTDEASYLLAYMIKYERETGKVTDSVTKVFERMGMSEWGDVFDVVNTIVTDDDLYNLVQTIAQYGDDIPDWAINMLANLARKKGLDLSAEELKQLLNIVAKTGEKLDDIVIHKNDGEDIEVPSAPSSQSSDPADAPQYQEVDVSGDSSSLDGDGSVIFVHFEELLSCVEELRQAVEDYNMAVELVRDAAEDLASKWEGAAKDAFCVHQENAYRWYCGISKVVDAIVLLVKNLRSMYVSTEDDVMQLMRG